MLEHIPDDKRALRELFRILKPGGWAILQSPVNFNRETTFEDFSIVLPHDRERVFGQKDHVRIYGRDYADRIKNAGFFLRLDDFAKKLGSRKIRKCALMRDETLFIGQKPFTVPGAPEASLPVPR